MNLQSRFLCLPRELRNLVYKFYVYEEDGYKFNSQTGKFATKSRGKRIDLSLMYTCLQVADEMRGVALGHNVVSFSTTYLDEYRLFAGVFHHTIHNDYIQKTTLVERYAPLLSEEKFAILEDEYPQLSPLVNHLRHRKLGPEWVVRATSTGYPIPRWGIVPSIYLDFLDRYVELGDFAGSAFDETWKDLIKGICPNNLIRQPRPWCFPSKKHLEFCYKNWKEDGVIENRKVWYPYQKYRFSAAATAINFLTISKQIGMQIRNIELLEDHPSVASPECHARGLIKFCQDNPKLKVTRKVDLWRNALLAKSFRLREIVDPSLRTRLWGLRNIPFIWISGFLGSWINEAMALSSLGMPSGSFSLIFDGGPAPKEASEVFDILQRDAVWQAAYENAYERLIIPHRNMQWFHIRSQSAYIFDGFPQAMKRITEKSSNSIVRCNFDVASPQHSVEEIINYNQSLSDEGWNTSYMAVRERRFCKSPPCLPSWHSMWRKHSVWRLKWTSVVLWGVICCDFYLLYRYFSNPVCRA